MATTPSTPAFVGVGTLLFGVLGYQYGNKKLRTLQARELAERKAAHEKEVASLQEQVKELAAQLEIAKGTQPLRVETTKAHESEVPANAADASWLEEWLSEAQKH